MKICYMPPKAKLTCFLLFCFFSFFFSFLSSHTFFPLPHQRNKGDSFSWEIGHHFWINLWGGRWQFWMRLNLCVGVHRLRRWHLSNTISCICSYILRPGAEFHNEEILATTHQINFCRKKVETQNLEVRNDNRKYHTRRRKLVLCRVLRDDPSSSYHRM